MRVLLLLNTSKSWIVATMARTQAVGGAHSALAGPIIACPAGKGRRLGQVPRVRNVIAASEAATRTTFVAFETDAPMRLVIGRKGATVTNFFAILTPEAKVVLGGIIKVPMACGAWPLPLASLENQLGHAQEIKKLPSHPAAAADRSLQERSVALPSEVTSPGGAGSDVAKPNTGDPVASGGTSTAQSKQHN